MRKTDSGARGSIWLAPLLGTPVPMFIIFNREFFNHKWENDSFRFPLLDTEMEVEANDK